MNKSIYLLAALSLPTFIASDCVAQGINNPLDDVHNPIGALKRGMERRRLIQYAGIADAENERLRAAGQARINAGQASTTFQRTIGPLAPARYGAQAPNPADRQSWTDAYAEGLAVFERLAAANKVNRNDVADGMGLALAVAYEVYSGGQQLATPEQRRGFTEATRQNLLQNAIFQSYSDQDRQLIFERHGMNAGLAAAKDSTAFLTGNDAMRDEAIRIARDTLAALWPYPVEGIELTSSGFEDRGVRLIREGKATTQFTPPPAPLVTDPQQLQLWRAFVQVAERGKIPMNDLAATMAVCILINWQNALAGQTLDQQYISWTYAGMKKIVLTSPDFQRMSDTEKESSLESYAIRTMAVNAEIQQAARPVAEQLSGALLAVARSNGFDQASLRTKRIQIVSYKAVANLDAIFAPKFANYILNENGFTLANAAAKQ